MATTTTVVDLIFLFRLASFWFCSRAKHLDEMMMTPSLRFAMSTTTSTDARTARKSDPNFKTTSLLVTKTNSRILCTTKEDTQTEYETTGTVVIYY